MTLHRVDPIPADLGQLGIEPHAAARLSHAGTMLVIPAGTTFCHQGERGTQAFLVLTGSATVVLDDRAISVGPGEVLGEMATLDSSRIRNASVFAETDIEVLVFDIGTFRSLAREDDLRARLVPNRSAA